jgi:hypothetical protein
MEDRVNVPRRGEVELGCYWGYEFCDGKGSVTFGGQLNRSVGCRKVLSF